jgi:4-amino-4-deoxychorismate lyase
MYRLLETIKLVDGIFQNLAYHTERLNRSRRELAGCRDMIDLQEVLVVPPACRSGIYKYRIVYCEHIISTTCEAYRPRSINSLKAIVADDIHYAYKFENREKLVALLGQKAGCDDILIIKGKRLTDSSFSNLAFFTGKYWFTPQRPLLKGTKRAQLLAGGIIHEADLTLADIKDFESVALINALLDLGECVVKIENIHL